MASTYPDVYFTPEYGRAAAVADDGTWHEARQTDKIIVPYVLRLVDDDSRDAVSPYGYSGMHVAQDCTAGELARFWHALRDSWLALGVVTMFFRFSPLDQASVRRAMQLEGLVVTRRPDTVTVPLGQGLAGVWAGMRGRSRTAIRKAGNAGLTGHLRPARPEDLMRGSPFRTHYEQTMVRVRSSPYYLFPDDYYRRLAAGLGERLLHTEIRDQRGGVVAAALVLSHGRAAHYHLAGSMPEAARDGANNLLVWTILTWAIESGHSCVHLGGGARADDGLFRFKSSFGGQHTPFWTGEAVIDPLRYGALVRTHARAKGRSEAEILGSGYFPGYRWT